MDIMKMLAELRAEREQVEEAIHGAGTYQSLTWEAWSASSEVDDGGEAAAQTAWE